MRAVIRSELQSISPMDALELRHRSEALAWVDSGAPLFRTAKPATPPQHLVSYFVVVDGESILLVDHKNAQLWLPPGGHVEEGEHPRDTVAREVREELGFAPAHEIAAPLMVTCTTTVGLTSGHTDVSLWYLVNAKRCQAMTFDAQEFNGIKWFEFSEAPLDRTDPHLERFILKLRSINSLERTMPGHRIFTIPFAKVYPLYVQKAERKGRTKNEVDQIIVWLTGYTPANLKKQIASEATFETFFARAPSINPRVSLIKGVVCGVRVEEVADPLMRKIRYLDKLIDELAKGKPMEKILRQLDQ